MDDGVFEFIRAADRGVTGVVILDGADGRLLDIIRRVKIRFPGPETNDILTLCL